MEEHASEPEFKMIKYLDEPFLNQGYEDALTIRELYNTQITSWTCKTPMNNAPIGVQVKRFQ